jgi:hypothetical protein
LGKESFLSSLKLSRKPSANKFNPFSKSKKQSSEVGTPDEIDDSLHSTSWLGNRMEHSPALEGGKGSPNIGGKEKSSSGLSWGSLMRKKKGDRTPSLHESVTSESAVSDAGGTTEDEDASALGLGVHGGAIHAGEARNE